MASEQIKRMSFVPDGQDVTEAELRAAEELHGTIEMYRTRAVIFDIDGVLCDNAHLIRKRHEEIKAATGESFTMWTAEDRAYCMEAPPRPEWVTLNQCMDPFTLVFLITNRSQDDADATMMWLKEHEVRHNGVFFWNADEHDYFAHKRISVQEVMKYYDVALVFDDTRRHCAMYEELGLKVIHVPGGFDE